MSKIRSLAVLGVLATMTLGFSAPAFAEGWRREGRHEWERRGEHCRWEARERREEREREWRREEYRRYEHPRYYAPVVPPPYYRY